MADPKAKKPTPVQFRILWNIKDGLPYDFGRPLGRSSAGGWWCSLTACHRAGWLEDYGLTDAGRAALASMHNDARRPA